MKPIMQHRPTFEKEEAEATYKYMLEDSFITEYKKTEELENMISKYLNCKECIMTTSGTCAIILSLMALDLNIGDEVIVPNYTMIATVNAIKMLKLKPVIIDVDKDTFTINLDTIKKNVTCKTKTIIHVSLNNRYKNMTELVNYCTEQNFYLIEDSAQSLGCRINGKNLGTFGNVGCFSLSSPKIISTGQGGFCVTDDELLAKKMRMIKNFGRRESGKDNFEVFGINLKFTDLQAVIGIEQMKKMDYRVKRMREIFDLYYNELKDIVEMKSPLNDEWIPWFVDIFTDKRTELITFLKKHKISTRPVYGEINKTKMYYNKDIFENSQYVSKNGLFLPSYITIKDEDIKQICKLIQLFYLNINSVTENK
jgi:perosamine synthetase